MAGLLACGWPLRPAFPVRCFRSGPVAYGASLAAYSCGGSHGIGAVCKTSNRALPCSLLTHRLHEAGGTIDGQDRKSVVEGKSVSVRVDLGGCRIIQKKKTYKK